MGLSVSKTALAIELQVSPDTWNAPDTSDLLPIANLRLQETGVTVQNPEYTGSVHEQGDIVAGSNVTLSFDVMLRPPGGADVPLAGAFLPGRLLRMFKFTENRVASAIPAAPEALSAGSSTGATFGAGAAGTADLYKGLLVKLSDNQGGNLPKALTMIRSYSASKVAAFAETLGSSPAANYQIPKQLQYHRDISETEAPVASTSVWLGGVRYDLINCAGSGLTFNVPTSTRDQAQVPVMNVTLNATVYATADDPTPSIPSLGAIPLFRDGDFWVGNVAVGGSSLTLNMTARSAAPPNPNKPDGSDASQLVGLKPTASLNLQKYLKATFDPRALASAQTYHPIWAMWGYTAGNIVSIGVTDARFNFPNPEANGDFWADGLDMLIDVATKNVSIVFPY